MGDDGDFDVDAMLEAPYDKEVYCEALIILQKRSAAVNGETLQLPFPYQV